MVNKWLSCEITKGMFSDEVTVKVHDSEGAPFAVFVPRSEVNEVMRAVNVQVVEGSGKIFAVLPDERRTSLAVPARNLQPA